MSAQSSIIQYDHFIPVSTHRLIEQLSKQGLDSTQLTVIRRLQQILSFEFSLKLRQIKKHYQPINPDNELSDLVHNENVSQYSIDSIRSLLVNANFAELNQQQIQFALEKISPYGLKIGLFRQISG